MNRRNWSLHVVLKIQLRLQIIYSTFHFFRSLLAQAFDEGSRMYFVGEGCTCRTYHVGIML
jgi:hypothetical protein